MKTSRFTKWLQEKLAPAFNKFAGYRIIRVLMGGFWFAMPIIFVGVVFQIIGNIGSLTLQTNPILLTKLIVLQNMSFGLMGIFFVLGIANADAKANKIETTGPMIFALIMFFMLIKPEFVPSDNPMVTLFQVNFSSLGASSMFLAIIAGLLSGEVCALFEKRGWTLKTKGLPQFMQGWFKDFFSGILLLAGIWVLVYLLDIDISALISAGLGSIMQVGDTLWAAMFMGALAAFSFALGIHPIAVFSLLMPFLMATSAENANLYNAHVLPQTLANGYHFHTLGIYFLFMMIGGTGATGGLNLLMLFSKVKSVKQLGRMAIFPSILNINEPLIFGCPVVFNPPLAIGAILIEGVISPFFAFIVLKTGLMPAPSSVMLIPFLPTPVLALILNTGIIGAILALVAWGLNTLCWVPFFKIYEKQMIDKEVAEAKSAS